MVIAVSPEQGHAELTQNFRQGLVFRAKVLLYEEIACTPKNIGKQNKNNSFFKIFLPLGRLEVGVIVKKGQPRYKNEGGNGKSGKLVSQSHPVVIQGSPLPQDQGRGGNVDYDDR